MRVDGVQAGGAAGLDVVVVVQEVEEAARGGEAGDEVGDLWGLALSGFFSS